MKPLAKTAIVVAAAGLLATGCEFMNAFQSPGRTMGQPTASSASGDEDGGYTIKLVEFTAETHVRDAEAYVAMTGRDTGWGNLQAVHRNGYSMMVWGSYNTPADAAKNLQKAKDFASPSGAHPFARALLIPQGEQDDVGPPEWNLAHANGYYTVQIAEFYRVVDADPPLLDPRGEAVELCTKLRKQGKEAYFFHDGEISGVTIGSFPASAIQTRNVTVHDPRNPDARWQEERHFRDDRIDAILREYPAMLVCGAQETVRKVNPVTGQIEEHYRASAPIRIENDQDADEVPTEPTDSPTGLDPRWGS